MKKTIILLLTMMVALHGAAIDRFYIEDFSITPGEAALVSILLDNELEYTAFQCDIYMPDGLTVEQEDGFYVVDLTSRKARSHVLYTALQQDGAIRLVCYSGSVSPFKGTTGALVELSVIASEYFTGPEAVIISNVRLGTTTGEEIFFPDEYCNVTTTETALIGDVDDDGVIGISDVVGLVDYLLYGDDSAINVGNADVYSDGEITIADVTELIDQLLAN